MKNRMGRFFVVMMLSSAGWAQSSDRVEIFGGYSHTFSDFGFRGGSTNGWNASVTLKSKLGLGFVSDFSGFYKTYANTGFPDDHSKTYLYLFGPQYSFSVHRFTPFAHVLFGVGHINYVSGGVSNTIFSTQPSFAYGFGGGVDCGLASHLALRVQGDYLHPGFVTTDSQVHGVPRENSRISTGIVFRF